MKVAPLLLFGCLLLAACASEEENQPGGSGTTALKHLQQDVRLSADELAREFSARLIPQPLTAAVPAEAVISGCRDATSYSWSLNGKPVATISGAKLPAHYFKRGDVVTLLATCGELKSTTSERVENSPPQISAVRFAGEEITSGADLTLVPEAEDVDGDPLEFSYQWTVNGQYLETISGPVLPGKYVKRGNLIAVDVTPADPFADGEVFAGIDFQVPNSPPQINSQPPVTVAEDYQYQVEANDPDGDPLSYRLVQGPEGMNISASGLISWQLSNVPAGGYTIEIAVTDAEGSEAYQSYTLNLSFPE